ncbi:MAG: isoprenylcysteine carboxylmethyltransferase family protein, partial [Candidatus Lokiarchaeota archaeon]|nr:isoprenylcysteine carboxylmethyltransferase family protein [Candidatus Lokiarchaeota archaeon]
PLLIRIIIFASLLILSFVLGNSSHKILFGGNNEATSLIKNGVFARVRHPLYLSMLLVYLAFALVSMSLICITFWILMFILYDRMASYEEIDLEKIFSEEYAEYKKRVGKWIPRLFSSKIENSK